MLLSLRGASARSPSAELLGFYRASHGDNEGISAKCIDHLIEGGRLLLAGPESYSLGGSFGEGHGTSFLEINSVEAIMESTFIVVYPFPILRMLSH